MSSDVIELMFHSAAPCLEPSSTSAVVVDSELDIAGSVEIPKRGTSSISGPPRSSGRGKRRSRGLTVRNRTTLMAPERLYVITPKNNGADDT
jgi:hypothetical protein